MTAATSATMAAASGSRANTRRVLDRASARVLSSNLRMYSRCGLRNPTAADEASTRQRVRLSTARRISAGSESASRNVTKYSCTGLFPVRQVAPCFCTIVAAWRIQVGSESRRLDLLRRARCSSASSQAGSLTARAGRDVRVRAMECICRNLASSTICCTFRKNHRSIFVSS